MLLDLSGLYVAGNAGLAVGARYLLQLTTERLAILGPVDRDPHLVALTIRSFGLDATGLSDRLLLTGRGANDRSLYAAFVSVGPGTLDAIIETFGAAAAAAAEGAA